MNTAKVELQANIQKLTDSTDQRIKEIYSKHLTYDEFVGPQEEYKTLIELCYENIPELNNKCKNMTKEYKDMV